MISNINPISISREIVTQVVGDEVFIYEIRTNKIWSLNKISSIVWGLCDGTNNIADLAKAVSAAFNADADESLILLTLDSLRKAGLLENGEVVMKTSPRVFSRREAIKKAGLTTTLALPVITSIIAPIPAHAQSGCISSGGACIFDNFTQSNCCDQNQRCREYFLGSYNCVNCDSGNQVELCSSVGCCTGIVEANRCCNGPIIERELFGSPGQYFCICP